MLNRREFATSMALGAVAASLLPLSAQAQGGPVEGTHYVKLSTRQPTLDPAKIEAEREQLYETILKSYADVKVEGSTLVVPAKRELFVIRHLSVGKVASDIEGEDLDGVKFKLSDYRGKVVLLDFWGDW